MPRWRLPVWLLPAVLLCGCAAHSEHGGEDSGMPVPSVRMALLKIPLNRADSNPLDNQTPLERFAQEPVAVAYEPQW